LDHASANCILGIVRKPSGKRGAWALFCGVSTHSEKDMDF